MWKTFAYAGQRGLALAPEPATKMQGFIFLTGTLETRERGLDALKQQRLFWTEISAGGSRVCR